LGNIEVQKGRLTVSVNSAERARVVRAEIEKRLAEKARFRFDEISDMDAMMGQKGEHDDSDLSREELLSHPEVRDHIEQMLRQHWKEWVDHSLGKKDSLMFILNIAWTFVMPSRIPKP
jgi:hypothetical protein